MKSNLDWKKAILLVLKEQGEPLGPSAIAELIQERGYRQKLGATPHTTVSSIINQSLIQEGEQSPFLRIARGVFSLKEVPSLETKTGTAINLEEAPASIVGALGMFWERSLVDWEKPKLLGCQQIGANTVDFSDEVGLYLLHDAQGVVYVGRAIDQPILKRLRAHTVDRLRGRWSRFSWFGVYSVQDNGQLAIEPSRNYPVTTLLTAMEAILIEALEPRQNRRRGDGLEDLEFLQVEAPERQNKKLLEGIVQLMSKA